MSEKRETATRPAFIVLRETGTGVWEFLGEFERKPGLSARAARTEAILEATRGTARAGEVYAAILRSEWKVAHDWVAPPIG